MTKQKTSGAFKVIKIISIVLTCSTLFIALMLVALLDSKNEGIVSFDQMYYMVNNLWVFYLLLPISLGCLGYGIFLSIKKYKAVSNIVIGSIFSFLLLIYGSFTPIFKPQYDTSSKYWDELGEKLSIDFSNDLKVVSMEYDIYKQTTSDNFWRNVESAARFTNPQSYETFVNSLNSNWTTSFQNNIVPATFALSTRSGFDKFLIYSFTDSTYNPASIVSKHKYVCIALSYEKQGMYMMEYTAK